jgi:hypothetical protein
MLRDSTECAEDSGSTVSEQVHASILIVSAYRFLRLLSQVAEAALADLQRLRTTSTTT